MPVVPQNVYIEGLRRLVEIDKDWVPGQRGTALYLRPFMIATESRLRIKISESYRFCIMTTPAGAYYEKPLRVKVETDFARAVKGGTGYIKCGGNYAASLYPASKAKEQGYDQVLWTDGIENKYIEESGAMNIFFVIEDTLVTPPLSDRILDGVTRDSLITLAAGAGIPVAERSVAVEELQEALQKGQVREAFGSGTAAVVSPIGTIGIGDVDYILPASGQGNISNLLRTTLDNIRYGREPDPYGWNFIV
jgi:branched-chain amino acid aminotransferase